MEIKNGTLKVQISSHVHIGPKKSKLILDIDEDAAEQIIDLTGISAGGGESGDLLVSVTSDNPGLIPTPEIVYTSPNSTGSLKYTPVADQSGTAEIVVGVTDGGADGNLGTPEDNETVSRTFGIFWPEIR